MKIFAKRKKRSTGATSSSSSEKRTENKSHPVVEKLLKMDPSNWNAKERRMVKRYEQRKEENATEKPIKDKSEELLMSGNGGTAELSDEPAVETNSSDNTEDHDVGKEASSTGDSSDSSSESPSASIHADSNSALVENVATEGCSEPTSEMDAFVIESKSKDKVENDHEIWNILNKLNSKQKRTLSRKLDQWGQSVLGQVENEARELLGFSQETPSTSKESKTLRNKIENESTTQPPKIMKRKRVIDWSSLSPEERLRREEQRRLQMEAAERRDREKDIKPVHKRPLNSARRRANRRKPKWIKPSSDIKNEHNSSGYMFRKHAGGEREADCES